MTIDVLCPNGVAVDVRDAVSEIAVNSSPELIGRIMQVLVDKKIIGAADLRLILPPDYEVRE